MNKPNNDSLRNDALTTEKDVARELPKTMRAYKVKTSVKAGYQKICRDVPPSAG